MATYRRERRQKQQIVLAKPVSAGWVGGDVDDLMSQTILEEEEDSAF